MQAVSRIQPHMDTPDVTEEPQPITRGTLDAIDIAAEGAAGASAHTGLKPCVLQLHGALGTRVPPLRHLLQFIKCFVLKTNPAGIGPKFAALVGTRVVPQLSYRVGKLMIAKGSVHLETTNVRHSGASGVVHPSASATVLSSGQLGYRVLNIKSSLMAWVNKGRHRPISIVRCALSPSDVEPCACWHVGPPSASDLSSASFPLP